MPQLNKWGVAAATALVLVIPASSVAFLIAGGNTPGTDVPGLILQLLAIWWSIVAARRGSRWWLVVSGLATLWCLSVVLQLAFGE
jgi:hypothetical protein